MITRTDSDNLNELAKALGDFQAGLRPVKRNMENPNFRSRYADLAAVVNHCKKRLQSYGLAVLQTASSGVVDGQWQGDVTTRLVHLRTGQFIQSNISVPCFDAQSLAKGITYGRRIAYATIVGLVVESEDDDGNASSGLREEGKPAGAMETSRVYVSEVLKATRRKGQPFYRFRGSDHNVYGSKTWNELLKAVHEEGREVDVTWKDEWGTRMVVAFEPLSKDRQTPEPAL